MHLNNACPVSCGSGPTLVEAALRPLEAHGRLLGNFLKGALCKLARVPIFGDNGLPKGTH